jgi:hypothetical protein
MSTNHSQLRRTASQYGYRLIKHHGRYFLVDPRLNAVVVGSPAGWTADEIADYFTES